MQRNRADKDRPWCVCIYIGLILTVRNMCSLSEPDRSRDDSSLSLRNLTNYQLEEYGKRMLYILVKRNVMNVWNDMLLSM